MHLKIKNLRKHILQMRSFKILDLKLKRAIVIQRMQRMEFMVIYNDFERRNRCNPDNYPGSIIIGIFFQENNAIK